MRKTSEAAKIAREDVGQKWWIEHHYYKPYNNFGIAKDFWLLMYLSLVINFDVLFWLKNWALDLI